MKILHFAPTLHPGSATRLAVDLAYALQAHGVESLVAAPPQPAAVMHGIDAHPLSPPLMPGRWWRVLQLRRLMRHYAPAIVQAYGCEAVRIAARACHGLPPARRPRLVAALTEYADTPHFARSAELRAADCTTAVSNHLRHAYRSVAAEPDKIWAIPYGADSALCYPGYQPPAEWTARLHAEHPELSGRYVICLPGPVAPRYGTADAVPILSSLLERGIPAHLIIAGGTTRCPKAYMAELRRSIHAAALAEHISWVGPDTALRDLLSSAHAVLCTAAHPAAYHRPILEALALGRPVVGYSHGVVAEYLAAFLPAGAVPPGSPAAAADLLAAWHRNPPPLPSAIPYPYRLSDTARTYHQLYTTLT